MISPAARWSLAVGCCWLITGTGQSGSVPVRGPGHLPSGPDGDAFESVGDHNGQAKDGRGDLAYRSTARSCSAIRARRAAVRPSALAPRWSGGIARSRQSATTPQPSSPRAGTSHPGGARFVGGQVDAQRQHLPRRVGTAGVDSCPHKLSGPAQQPGPPRPAFHGCQRPSVADSFTLPSLD
jgi:hypothetical protein